MTFQRFVILLVTFMSSLSLCAAVVPFLFGDGGEFEGGSYLYVPPPIFMQVDRNRTYLERETVQLRCAVRNLGNNYVAWSRSCSDEFLTQGGRVTAAADQNMVVQHYTLPYSISVWNLVIRGVTAEQAGSYDCHIVTRMGSKRTAAKLKVVGKDIPMVNSVPEGQELSLDCAFAGKTLQWLKDGVVIEEGSNPAIQITTVVEDQVIRSTLKIANSKPQDAGSYICRGDSSQEIEHIADVRREPDQRLFVVEDLPAVMDCLVRGSTATWFHDRQSSGFLASSSSSSSPVLSSSPAQGLSITNTQSPGGLLHSQLKIAHTNFTTDGGMYSCVGSNGDLSTFGLLVMTDRDLTRVDFIYATYDSPVGLYCVVPGTSAAWTKDGRHVSPQKDARVSIVERPEGSFVVSKLVISDWSWSDSGDYVCSGSDPTSIRQYSAQMQPPATTFNEPYVEHGLPFGLFCAVNGTQVSWYKGEKMVGPPLVHITNQPHGNQTYSWLEVDSSQWAHSDKYFCRDANDQTVISYRLGITKASTA